MRLTSVGYSIAVMLLVMFLVMTSFQCEAKNKGTHERISDHLQGAIPAFALAHSYFKYDDAEGAAQMAQGLIASTLMVAGLKSQVNATRPSGACCDSFPSAHSVAAFQPAFYIHNRYGAGESLPYFIAATYMGYARIQSDEHHFRDVAASVLISYGISHYFTSRFGEGENAKIGIYAGEYGELGVSFNLVW